jgi:predicted PurR-regulated permease PerM
LSCDNGGVSQTPRKSEQLSEPEQRRFELKVLIACSIAIAMATLAVFLWYSIQVLLLIFAGVLIAILLRGLSDWVGERTGLPHAASLAIVILVMMGALGTFFWLSAPRLVHEIGELAEQIPPKIEQMRARIEAAPMGGMLLKGMPQLDAMMRGRGDLFGSVTGWVSSTLGAVVSVMVVLFTGMFLAAAPRMYVRGLLHLVPPKRRDRMAEVLGAIGYTLKWWMTGQAIDMVVIGAATALGLYFLGVPLALLLGFLAALFNFIPNFGPLFSLVPALLLTFPVDPTKAFYVLILYIVLQNIEGNLLMPYIQGKAVDLPSALTIVSQVLMGILAGGLGLALAAPLAAATLVAVKMLYVEDTLGDRIKTPADHDAREEVREAKKAAAETERDGKSNPESPEPVPKRATRSQ